MPCRVRSPLEQPAADCLASAPARLLSPEGSPSKRLRQRSSDVAATRAYVEADYRLMSAAVRKIPGSRSRDSGSPPRCAQRMPERGSGIAAEPDVHPTQQRGHRGDGARRRKEGPVISPSRSWAPVRGCAGAVAGLTREVQAYVGHVRVLSKLAPPDLCGDVRAWASSGFQKLAPATEAFDRVFMPNWGRRGQPARRGLSRFEQGPTGSLARRASSLEATFTDFRSSAGRRVGGHHERARTVAVTRVKPPAKTRPLQEHVLPAPRHGDHRLG